jgi:hypothetical protein
LWSVALNKLNSALAGLRQKTKTLALVAATLVASVAASSAHALTPAEKQEIYNFTLTDSFLQRYTAAMEEGNANHIGMADHDTDSKKALEAMRSLDTMTAQVSKSPPVVALLQRHGLSPRQVVLGGLVLLRLQMADMVAANPAMAKYAGASKAETSPANAAFYHSHRAQIAKLQADIARTKE